MFEPLRKIFRARQVEAASSVPVGERFYVVGDIHGRLDLFEALVEAIDAENAQATGVQSTVVMLGDLVDRGPDSAGVVDLARRWQSRRKVRILAGNHEEMFLESFTDIEVLRHFLKFGGRETLLSYGLSRKEYNRLTLEELFDRMPEIVSQADRDFIAGFEEFVVAGDYLFVHAGVDPARPLEEQKRSDMLWIRERFLRHEGPLSHIVVHGHTIFDEVEDCGYRIGIDTGAYKSGRLTALVLEGASRRLITAFERKSRIAIENEELKS